jgi:hypothetical protein
MAHPFAFKSTWIESACCGIRIRVESNSASPINLVLIPLAHSSVIWQLDLIHCSKPSAQPVAISWTTRVRFPVWPEIFLCTTTSKPALEPNQPPLQWIPGALSSWVNRSERVAEYTTPCSAEVKNAWIFTSVSLHLFTAWCSNTMEIYE